MDDWKRFGMVEGVLWLGRWGLTLRYTGPRFEHFESGAFTCRRFWPFVVVHANPLF